MPIEPTEWAITIVQNLLKFIPRREINEWEDGFRVRRGKIMEYERIMYSEEPSWRPFKFRKREGIEKVKNLGPGVYWYWPIFEHMEIEAVSTDVVDTPRQDLKTKDDVHISLSCSLEYRKSDLAQYYQNLKHDQGSVLNYAQRAIASEITSRNYETIKEEMVRKKGAQSSTLEKAFLEETQRLSRDCGVNIMSIGLENFTTARTYRVIGNTNGGSHYEE